MNALKLISFFSYLLIFIPSENGTPILFLIFVSIIGLFQNAMSGFSLGIQNLENGCLGILIITSLLCLILSKKGIVKIISYLILCVILFLWFYNVNYKGFNFNILNVIFCIIMPLLFIISSYFIAFNKKLVIKK